MEVMAVDASAAENNRGLMRERELEVEIARLNAELAVFKGDREPTEIAARFLSMAASTVDQAMADVRRKAEKLEVEVASAAEARRDEATRVAEQVKAETEALRIEANNQQAAAQAARYEAQRITDAATDHINKERARVAEEQVEKLNSEEITVSSTFVNITVLDNCTKTISDGVVRSNGDFVIVSKMCCTCNCFFELVAA